MLPTTLFAIAFILGAALGFGVGYLVKAVSTEKPQWLVEQEARELNERRESGLNKRNFTGPSDSRNDYSHMADRG